MLINTTSFVCAIKALCFGTTALNQRVRASFSLSFFKSFIKIVRFVCLDTELSDMLKWSRKYKDKNSLEQGESTMSTQEQACPHDASSPSQESSAVAAKPCGG